MRAGHHSMIGGGAEPLPYDAKVKWIESTGTQYIDLGAGVFPLAGYIAFDLTVMGGTNRAMFGQQINGTRLLLWLASTSSSYVDRGTQSRISYSTTDITQTKARYTAASSHDPRYIFTSIQSGGPRPSYAIVRLRSLQVWNDKDNLALDLVPVRVGTEGALYDRVTGSVFRSKTSTPLAPGPDNPS